MRTLECNVKVKDRTLEKHKGAAPNCRLVHNDCGVDTLPGGENPGRGDYRLRARVENGLVKQMVDKANGYGEHIIRDKRICGGEPVFRGTRVTLRTVLASLAAGETAEAILEQFPTLNAKHVGAAIAFAAASAEEDLPVRETPHVR
jgi:uncharacterized protein (DUF433 family)